MNINNSTGTFLTTTNMKKSKVYIANIKKKHKIFQIPVVRIIINIDEKNFSNDCSCVDVVFVFRGGDVRA